MKNHIIITALAVSTGFLTTGCADNDIDTITVEKPGSIAQYEYLDDYAHLKSYIDRTAHPTFRFGTGVAVSDYNKKGLVYLLTNNNFDIMTAGNAMKYASIVNDKGEMDFSNVTQFVENARNAGIEIYGHTLCWHEQQNAKWLNSLIKDKELEVDPSLKEEAVDYLIDYSKVSGYTFWAPDDVKENISINTTDGCFELVNGTAIEDYWNVQYHVADGIPVIKGQEYKLHITVRGSGQGTLRGKIGDWSSGHNLNIPFDTDWHEEVISFNAQTDGAFVLLQSGDFVGTIQIKQVKVTHLETPVQELAVSLITGGDAADGECANVIARAAGAGDTPAPVVEDSEGTGKVFAASFNANPAEEWDSQLFIASSEPLFEGDKVHVKFRYRCTENRSIETQAHGAPGSYHYHEFIGTINATTQWQDYEWTGKITANQAGDDGCQAIAFNLCKGSTAGYLYIDDVVFEKKVNANTIPLTPEEKAEILETEMERWIAGMMEATQGYVKAWDVVNEAISGGPWGQRYDLQHAANDPDAARKFYWQDYLGDDFVRIPVRYARKHFEENGGDPDDLKLFVNDYNLESTWDDNQKLKSLISWIEQWESDGITKIDGIGSQMHVTYSLNPDTQRSQEEHVVKMLQLMAATGKLVRITELDMAISDENGNSIPTSKVTLEQHRLMADYYKFIIRKYFEIVPVEQQFGITMWCQTDSPDDSGWRPGEPTGIWDLGFNRKPAYAGIADGLADKE